MAAKSHAPRRRLQIAFVLTFLHALVFLLDPIPASWIEAAHARLVFPAVRAVLGTVPSLLPLPVGQLVVVGWFGLLIGALAQTILLLLRRSSSKRVALLFVWTSLLAVHLYLLGFGWLYRRPSLATRLALPAVTGADDLQRTSLDIARRTALARCPAPAGLTLERANELAREAVQAALPLLGAGTLPPLRPKAVWPDGTLLRFGVSGVFSPFTQEPHVDAALDPLDLIFVIAHELAHAAGFAPEDEANFVAWLACTRSPEPFLRYAGQVAALGHFESAAAPELHERLRHLAGDAVLADRRRAAAVRRQYRSETLHRMQRGVYDRVLKSQGVASGIASYSEVVRLILAWEARR